MFNYKKKTEVVPIQIEYNNLCINDTPLRRNRQIINSENRQQK